ncbi:hypothetical protein [Microterricola viridarii]|uniref:Uncharacterized protein n=1 Tax=Microterricola viridarii TaxID=412690 RepID=A0A1H1T4L3_9MICO|nr:hypothetical protein [Microterricola viridarii]SDS55140.1 hypothetical protein SAMN04489834_1688 [Microterricola viridarii]
MAEPELSEVIDSSSEPREIHLDVAAYRAAKASDNGERISLGELLSERDAPTMPGDAALIASEIAAALVRADVDSDGTAFRRFIQLDENLAAESGATRFSFTLTEPAPTGSARWDTAIAALCAYRLNSGSLPIPDWVSNRNGNQQTPWVPPFSRYNSPVDLAQVPVEFLRGGILIQASTLESE